VWKRGGCPGDVGGTVDWYIKAVTNYVGFEGRARRKEYWFFVLFNFLISLGIGMVEFVFGFGGLLGGLYWIAMFMPGLAVTFRRLHDTDKSAWNLLWIFLPLLGWLVLFVFMLSNSSPETNKYGPSPKAA